MGPGFHISGEMGHDERGERRSGSRLSVRAVPPRVEGDSRRQQNESGSSDGKDPSRRVGAHGRHLQTVISGTTGNRLSPVGMRVEAQQADEERGRRSSALLFPPALKIWNEVYPVAQRRL